MQIRYQLGLHLRECYVPSSPAPLPQGERGDHLVRLHVGYVDHGRRPLRPGPTGEGDPEAVSQGAEGLT